MDRRRAAPADPLFEQGRAPDLPLGAVAATERRSPDSPGRPPARPARVRIARAAASSMVRFFVAHGSMEGGMTATRGRPAMAARWSGA